MPAHERTTRAAIIAAGLEVLEERGLPGLTMHEVAQRVGVRAPSLYKRVRDRDDLIDLVVAATLEDLTGRLEAAAPEADPRRRLVLLAATVRQFAREHPAGYSLIFASAEGTRRADLTAVARSVGPVLDTVTLLVGEEQSLDAARLLTAWSDGFIRMELSGAFRMGGDVDRAWNWGIERIVAALTP